MENELKKSEALECKIAFLEHQLEQLSHAVINLQLEMRKTTELQTLFMRRVQELGTWTENRTMAEEKPPHY